MDKFTEREIEILQSLVIKKLNEGDMFYVSSGVFQIIPFGEEGSVLKIENGKPTWVLTK